MFDAFNQLITKNMRDGEARVSLAVVEELIKRKENLSIVNPEWLDVTSAYEKVGWRITHRELEFGSCLAFCKQ